MAMNLSKGQEVSISHKQAHLWQNIACRVALTRK